MSEDTTMTESELRQAVESMRAQIAALSGRIDGLDRGEILRGVNDGRRDKLAERHAQAFGRHSGDGVAHHYRDYTNPHRLPGMKEVRVFEAVGTSIPRGACAVAQWNGSGTDERGHLFGSGTIPFTSCRISNSSVLRWDAVTHSIQVLQDGIYLAVLRAQLLALRDPDESYPISSVVVLSGGDSASNSQRGELLLDPFEQLHDFLTGPALESGADSHTHNVVIDEETFVSQGPNGVASGDHNHKVLTPWHVSGNVSVTIPMLLTKDSLITGTYYGGIKQWGTEAYNTLSVVRIDGAVSADFTEWFS